MSFCCFIFLEGESGDGYSIKVYFYFRKFDLKWNSISSQSLDDDRQLPKLAPEKKEGIHNLDNLPPACPPCEVLVLVVLVVLLLVLLLFLFPLLIFGWWPL